MVLCCLLCFPVFISSNSTAKEKPACKSAKLSRPKPMQMATYYFEIYTYVGKFVFQGSADRDIDKVQKNTIVQGVIDRYVDGCVQGTDVNDGIARGSFYYDSGSKIVTITVNFTPKGYETERYSDTPYKFSKFQPGINCTTP